jgi:hypothetical protein
MKPIFSFPCDIPIRAGTTLRVLNRYQFEIHDFAAIFSLYTVPSTSDLDTVLEVLKSPDWTEDEINAAVEALNDREEVLAMKEGE